MSLAEHVHEILRNIPNLPDSAVIPIEAVAAHDNVSTRTVRRGGYPLVKLSPNRVGVPLGYLRNRQKATTA